MSKRVEEIRALLEPYAKDGDLKPVLEQVWEEGLADACLFLLSELDRATRVVEAVRDVSWSEDVWMGDAIRALHEYDSARSPDQAGGTAVVDAGEG